LSAGGRVLTTHTGSLPRPSDLLSLLLERQDGGAVEEHRFADVVERSTAALVSRQAEVGLDLVNDGEAGKISYATYVRDRMDGFDAGGRGRPMADLQEFPDYANRLLARSPRRNAVMSMACVGPVRARDLDAVARDVEALRRAVGGLRSAPAGVFMTAASPGVITRFFENQHYATEEEYLWAVADAMRPEYRAVVDAGFLLQVDCPDLASARNTVYAGRPLEEFRRAAARQVEALNWALEGLSPERMRIHVCWGNYPGPHHRDVELRDVLDILLRAAPVGLSLEASNPRHAHEWAVFESIPLPADKVLLPGVVDSTCNYVEHPDLVAQRLLRYVGIAGAERVIASTDCGFATFAGLENVDPAIAWAKLGALVEGARRASQRARS
jgi:5-methyltetrahydropteroyltriglutamate--homocysteine methyltransferase